MKTVTVRKIVAAALLAAVGIILPQVFHRIGGQAAGAMFLPMHLPVLLAGFTLGAPLALACAAVILTLSFALTGMPPLPALWMIAAQLAVLAAASGLRYEKTHGFLRVSVSIVIAQIAGLLVYGLAAVPVLHLKLLAGLALAFGGVRKAVPGFLLQIVLVPLLVRVFRRWKL
ncbi:MAG: ECF transporter S component [Oscillospiraceae bacterium]|jgi:niacin transporter|nr:ECF transporter S component [Oscillospiraceae bacterium]